MHRECSHCLRPFTAHDFAKGESRQMEMDRRSAGLEGVRFPYYACPDCGYADIFVDLHPLEGESPEAFQRRKTELEATVRKLHGDKTDVVLTPR